MKRYLVAFLALGLALGTTVWAAGRGVNVDRTAVAVGYIPSVEEGDYRSMFSIADVTTSSDLEGATILAAATPLYCGGCTTIKVIGVFQASAATASIAVVRYRTNAAGSEECRGYTTGTLTAVTSTPKIGSLYPSGTLYFDTECADRVRIILLTNVSSQGVKLRAEAY